MYEFTPGVEFTELRADGAEAKVSVEIQTYEEDSPQSKGFRKASETSLTT